MTREFTPVPDAEQVTDEMIDAVTTLRALAVELLDDRGDSKAAELARHIVVLDRAGFFAPADEAKARDEEMHARLIAGLRGIDLNDRYPVGDENGIIRSRREGD